MCSNCNVNRDPIGKAMVVKNLNRVMQWRIISCIGINFFVIIEIAFYQSNKYHCLQECQHVAIKGS